MPATSPQSSQYLNETSYQKNKKRLTILSLVIFLLSLLIGGGLIATGVILTNNAKSDHSNTEIVTPPASQPDQIDDPSLRSVAEINLDITATQIKINTLTSEISQLEAEKDRIFIEDFGFSDRYYTVENSLTAKNSELFELQAKLADYQTELSLAEERASDTSSDSANRPLDKIGSIIGPAQDVIDTATDGYTSAKYVPFYLAGGFIAIAGSLVALALFLFAKGREVAAFKAQQVLPLAKEGLDQLTPSASRAAGSFAESISRGIKNGLKESDSDQSIPHPPRPHQQ